MSHERIDPLEICSLPPEGLEDRLRWVREEILPHASNFEPGKDSVAWELEDAPGLAEKLDALIALEQDCCSGISFAQHAGAGAGQRRLEIRGVDPEAAVFQALRPQARRGLVARVARATGVGAGLALVICCIVPIGAAALLGAAVAAPLASLDNPWLIAGSSLLFGGAAYVWQSR